MRFLRIMSDGRSEDGSRAGGVDGSGAGVTVLSAAVDGVGVGGARIEMVRERVGVRPGRSRRSFIG